MKLAIAGIFIIGLLAGSGRPTFGAGFCVVPDIPDAIHRAQVVFSGRIIEVSSISSDKRKPDRSEYLVKFVVERWWKGEGTTEVHVVWVPEMLGCSYFPVPAVGETFLVYADELKSGTVNDPKFEVTIFNRTSRIRLIKNSSLSVYPGLELDPKPMKLSSEVDRADASNDLEVLRRVLSCGCSLSDQLPTCISPSFESQFREADKPVSSKQTSPCCKCLRQLLR